MNRSRWKDVEREVARQFSAIVSGVGKQPIARIPLLGREGPDLTVGDTGLVINVKSRKVIPVRLMVPRRTIMTIGDLSAFRLDEYTKLTDLSAFHHISTRPLKMLTDWYDHMDKWTREFEPNGITSIFLHRPKMPIGAIAIVIKTSDLRRLP